VQYNLLSLDEAGKRSGIIQATFNWWSERCHNFSVLGRPKCFNWSARSTIGYWHHNVVCPSVCYSSAVNCWLWLQEKCLNRWIDGTTSNSLLRPLALKLPIPKFPAQYDRLTQQQPGFLLI